MRAWENECLPGPVGKASDPQALMVSFTPKLTSDVDRTAAQSSKKRTSDLASSNKLWIADQLTAGDKGSWLLYIISEVVQIVKIVKK